MRPGFESHVTFPQTIALGFRSSQDPQNAPHLSHERKKHCESLCTEATIKRLILLAGNYPVAIVSMICLCLSVVNGLNKAAATVLLSQLFSGANKIKSNFS
jgi:hypothetical protein